MTFEVGKKYRINGVADAIADVYHIYPNPGSILGPQVCYKIILHGKDTGWGGRVYENGKSVIYDISLGEEVLE
jgi:hypothetical protein